MTGSSRVVRGVGILLGLVVVALAYVYAVSERVIHRKYDVPLSSVSVPTDSSAIEEGRRIAKIRGCFGCHGARLEGDVFRDDFLNGRWVAPNLTRVAREYSTAELARVIRYGVRANGEGVHVMPSPMYYHLSDRDLGRMIAFLRASPRVEGPDYEFRPGPMIRWRMVTGEWYPWPEDILRMGPRLPAPEPTDSIRWGEYLARTACTECHGNDFEGDPFGGPAPNLALVAAYSLHDFSRLMRTGSAVDGRDLGMMSSVAQGRFSHFTNGEIRAVYLFLRDRIGLSGD